MNNYNSILDCIDEMNDTIVTAEYSVASAMVDSYLKMSELFTECYERGGDPYVIYQEASVMDMVKDRAKNDKNGFVTFLKFIPRLIIAIIEKIKNKLLNKNNGDVSVKGSDVEKANKEISKKKTGTMAVAGGLLLAATATGGVLIYRNRKNKNSNGETKTEEPEVKVEVTKESEVKTNVDVEAIQQNITDLLNRMQKLSDELDFVKTDIKNRHDAYSEGFKLVGDVTKELDEKIANIESNQVNFVVKDDFNKKNQEIHDQLAEFNKNFDEVQKNINELSKNTDERFSNSEAEISDLKKKNKEDRAVMGIMYQYSKQNRNDINTLKKQNTENRKALLMIQQEINKLHAMVTENKKQIGEMGKQLSSTKSQASNLNAQINSLIKSINNTSAENKSVGESLNALRSYVGVMTKQVDKLEISMKKSSAKLFALDNVVGKNASSISEIQNKLEDTISKSNDDSVKVSEEIEKIKNTITKAQTMYDKLREFVDADRHTSKKQESEIKNMKAGIEKESKLLEEMVNQFCAEFHKKELEYDKLVQTIESQRRKDGNESAQEKLTADSKENQVNTDSVKKIGSVLSSGLKTIMSAVSKLADVSANVEDFKKLYAEKYGSTIESTDEENDK